MVIKNIGEIDANRAKISIYDDTGRNLADDISVSEISRDSTKIVNFYWTAEKGAHKIYFEITECKPHESNYTNNVYSVSVHVHEHNLDISIIDIGFSKLIEGVNVSITVLLQSNLRLENVKIIMKIDGILKGAKITSIDENTNISFTWVAIRGNHTIKIEVDPDNMIKESNETNNVKFRNITVLPIESIDDEVLPLYKYFGYVFLFGTFVACIILALILSRRKIRKRKDEYEEPPTLIYRYE